MQLDSNVSRFRRLAGQSSLRSKSSLPQTRRHLIVCRNRIDDVDWQKHSLRSCFGKDHSSLRMMVGVVLMLRLIMMEVGVCARG